MSTQQRPRLNIAICGGGPGGLSLAVILNKLYSDRIHDIHIDLYESAPAFTQIGAGISVWKRTWSIFRSLGLHEELSKMAISPPVEGEMKPSFILRKSDQSEPGFNFMPLVTPYGAITFHRKDVLKVLTDNLPPSDMFTPHFSKRLVSYEELGHNTPTKNKDNGDAEGSGLKLIFSDGTTAVADILVGADGIKSAVRAAMYKNLAKKLEEDNDFGGAMALQEKVQPSWTGTYAYRALVDTEMLLKKYPGHQAATRPMVYCGKLKHVVSYPISQGKLVNLVPFVTVPGAEGTTLPGPAMIDHVKKEEVLNAYEGWEPEVMDLLDCMDQPSRWAISTVRGLPTFVDGRVALLGDAAHAMSTHLGAGAGQAIEDAFILGHILSDIRVSSISQSNRTRAGTAVGTISVEDAFRAYDTARRPFATEVVERSRTVGFLYEFDGLEAVGTAGTDRRSDTSDAASTVSLTSKATPPDLAKQLASGDRDALDRLGNAIYARWAVQWAALPDVEVAIAKRALNDAASPGTSWIVQRLGSLFSFVAGVLDSVRKGMVLG